MTVAVRGAAPLLDEFPYGGAWPLRQGGEAVAEQVQEVSGDLVPQVGGQFTVPDPDGEGGELLGGGRRGRGVGGHQATTATGRIGEPVPPTIRSGAMTKRNSC